MGKFIAKRLGLSAGILLLVVFIIYLLMNARLCKPESLHKLFVSLSCASILLINLKVP